MVIPPPYRPLVSGDVGGPLDRVAYESMRRPYLERADGRAGAGGIADSEAQVLGVIDSFVEQHRDMRTC